MRVFVAAWPPPEVRVAIGGLLRPEADGVRWTPEDAWHATLRFLGEVPDPAPVIDALRRELTGRGVRPAELDARTSLLGRHLVVGVDGLRSLSTLVRLATAHHGEPPTTMPFVGHLTVARGRSVPAELVGTPVPGASDVAWEVSEVAVVRSLTAPPTAPAGTPNTYTRLATVSLL